jgi:hypothetical protein
MFGDSRDWSAGNRLFTALAGTKSPPPDLRATQLYSTIGIAYEPSFAVRLRRAGLGSYSDDVYRDPFLPQLLDSA